MKSRHWPKSFLLTSTPAPSSNSPVPQSATRVRSGNLESPRHRDRRDPLPFIHNVVSAAKDEIADSTVRRRYRLDVPRVFPLAAAARTRHAFPALTHAVRHTTQ